MPKVPSLTITDLSGGRNGYDPPLSIPDDQCVEALNVDFNSSDVAHKRNGATSLSLTFSSGGPFVNVIDSLVRHVPGNDETAAELWGFDATSPANIGRLAASTQWVTPSMGDAVTSSGVNAVMGASLGGFLFLAFKTNGGNRLHVWDASLSTVRRVGFPPPAAPTLAALGGGGLTFTRFYRVRWVDISGSDTRRRSEPSATATISISAKIGVQLTRPALASENETHWEIEYADAVAGPWHRAIQVVASQTTFNDTDALVLTTNLSASIGINTAPPSAKFILSDDNRLLMAGCWETTGGFTTTKNNRVWWTPVIGSTDVGDSERIVFNTLLGNGYLDVEEAITAIAGPIQGAIFVFGYRRIWKLVPTGLASAPYQRFGVSKGIGCISQQSIVYGEDEQGNPSIYFWSHRGPYRIGVNGLQYLGTDLEDLLDTVNLAASGVVVCGIYHADVHQVWWWVATGSATRPSLKLVFDPQLGRLDQANRVRRGWCKHTGDSASATCAVMFSNTVGATMSRDLKPYVGLSTVGNKIYKCDSSATDDAGVAFQAYVETKEYGTIGANHEIGEGVLVGLVASGVTVSVTVLSDFSLETPPAGTALLTAAGTETRVQKRLEGLQTSGVGTFRVRIGDASAVSNNWTVEAVALNVTGLEPRSA